MNFIKKSSSTFVLKILTLGYFGSIVCRNLSVVIMHKLKSLEWLYCSVCIPASALCAVFGNFRGLHEQTEAGQLLQVPGNDGPAPLNNRVADVKTTMPHVPPARRVKKSVSISENVEEIVPSKKWNRKIYGMDNEDVKPLKSILKVGSRIREKQ